MAVQNTLDAALKIYSQKEVAAYLRVDPKTVWRWTKGNSQMKPAYEKMVESFSLLGDAMG